MDQNWQKKRPRELNSKKSRKIPRELNSVLNRESENIAPEGVKKENKPFRVKNQFFLFRRKLKMPKRDQILQMVPAEKIEFSPPFTT